MDYPFILRKARLLAEVSKDFAGPSGASWFFPAMPRFARMRAAR